MASAPENVERFAEGFHVDNPSPEALREVLEAAFDYRGDVTLFLAGGGSLSGYIFNRDAGSAEPYIELYPQGSRERRRILYRDITGVAFTGRDPAAGKSWETWMKKYREARAARERGEASGPIGLQPESLG